MPTPTRSALTSISREIRLFATLQERRAHKELNLFVERHVLERVWQTLDTEQKDLIKDSGHFYYPWHFQTTLELPLTRILDPSAEKVALRTGQPSTSNLPPVAHLAEVDQLIREILTLTAGIYRETNAIQASAVRRDGHELRMAIGRMDTLIKGIKTLWRAEREGMTEYDEIMAEKCVIPSRYPSVEI